MTESATRPGESPGGYSAGHVSVMADEVMEWLRVRPGGVYVDCTVGAGGHSVLIAAALAAGASSDSFSGSRFTGSRLIGLDRDASSVRIAQERLASYSFASVLHCNYGELASVLKEIGILQVDGVLIDAGLSSMQIDTPERGFSFQTDAPLDMRMDNSSSETAITYLSRVTEDELARALRDYADVGPTRRIAKSILDRRAHGALNTTRDLVAAVEESLDFLPGMPEEVRTVFQAIRIAVNDEYHWLEAGLLGAIDVLAPEGRLVAISFHSGEDRIVKNVLRDASRAQRSLFPDGRVQAVRPPVLRVLTSKPVRPGDAEIRRNPRCQSARLRAAERLVGEAQSS